MNHNATSVGAATLHLPRWWIGALVVATMLAAGACDPPPDYPVEEGVLLPDENARGIIAVVGAGQQDPLWPIIRTGAQRCGEELTRFEVRCLAPTRRSPQDQIALLESLTDPDLRGLCIQPVDAAVLDSVLEPIYSRGVRIVSIMQPIPEERRVGHVGFDESAVGRALADLTAKALNNAGPIMVLHAGYRNPVYGPRWLAFKAAIQQHLGIEIFADLDCHLDPALARREIQQRSQRFPRLAAWVAMADWPLQDPGWKPSLLPEHCGFITVGGVPSHWPLLERGISPGLVAANYREIGERAVRFCEGAIRRASRIKPVYSIPLRNLWPANLDEYKRDWAYWSTGQLPRNAPGLPLPPQ